jgi:hypothetical protein
MQAFISSSTYVGNLEFILALLYLIVEFSVASKSVTYNKGVYLIWGQGECERNEGLSDPKLMGI